MRNKLLLTLFAAAVIGSALAAQAAEIWGPPIMKQPFDKEPLREINIPEWVQNLKTVTYCFSVMGPEARERAAKAGSEISELNFVDPFSCYYDSQYFKNKAPDGPAKIAAEIAAYNKMGVKILGVIPPGLQREIYNAHPEWRRIGTDTKDIPPADDNPNGIGGPLCQIGPYGDYMIDILCEIVKKYPDVKAFSFDGLHNYGGCFCQDCRVAFRKDTGMEIPKGGLRNPEFRKYQYWLDRGMESFVERMQTRLKTINPEIALITWSTNAGRWGHLLSIPRNMSARMNLLFDAPDQEFWMDETNRGNTVASAFGNAYMWAVSNHRVAFSTPYIVSHGNPYGADSFPPQEVVRRTLLVVTHGPRPSYSLAAGGKSLVDAMFAGMAEAQKRDPWVVKRQPEPWAAMVMSDNTNVFYGGQIGDTEQCYLSNVMGTFRASLETHLPMTVICDWNLNLKDLSKYKVLVLPNTACISDEQAEAIRQYVKNGGGLVASCDASRFDEMGNARDEFALADVFGVSYQGIAVGGRQMETLDANFLKSIDASYWEKRKGIFDFAPNLKSPLLNSPKMKEYIPTAAVCFKGQAVTVSADKAQTVATITSREPNATPLPAITIQNYGRGKVVYLAAGFDSANYLFAYPYQRLILARAIRWAASEQPKIEVDAPRCVQATFYRQKTNGQRLVVHLFNDFNSASNHAKPEDDVPLPEEIVQIRDIKVSFRDYNITRVHLEPEGIDLKMTKAEGVVKVTVPKLNMHSMVVAELK